MLALPAGVLVAVPRGLGRPVGVRRVLGLFSSLGGGLDGAELVPLVERRHCLDGLRDQLGCPLVRLQRTPEPAGFGGPHRQEFLLVLRGVADLVPQLLDLGLQVGLLGLHGLDGGVGLLHVALEVLLVVFVLVLGVLATIPVLNVHRLLLAQQSDHRVDVCDDLVEVPASRGRGGDLGHSPTAVHLGDVLQRSDASAANAPAGGHLQQRGRGVREDSHGLLAAEDLDRLVEALELLRAQAHALAPHLGLLLAALLGGGEESFVGLQLLLGVLAQELAVGHLLGLGGLVQLLPL
mmetsp:Transcript_34757/g.90928  ORF Transcript_34757/g.90928 Transcript_34757/m.90928 type:complete len:293 (+) Transcript_34757:468-1346(+)